MSTYRVKGGKTAAKSYIILMYFAILKYLESQQFTKMLFYT